MSAAVGADVEALCAKCGDVWHVVFAKEGEKIVKVQCKQCMAYHRYKAPHGAPAAAKQPRALREPKAPVERFEKPAVAANDKAAVPYKASEKYEEGDRIIHPTFGDGVVEAMESGKITVFFPVGRKVLAAAKTSNGELGGGLSKPRKFDHENPPAGGKPATSLK